MAKRNPAVEIKASDILKSVWKTNDGRIDAKQLSDLLKKIEFYQGTHVTRLAIELLALTFVPTSEYSRSHAANLTLKRAAGAFQPNG